VARAPSPAKGRRLSVVGQRKNRVPHPSSAWTRAFSLQWFSSLTIPSR